MKKLLIRNDSEMLWETIGILIDLKLEEWLNSNETFSVFHFTANPQIPFQVATYKNKDSLRINIWNGNPKLEVEPTWINERTVLANTPVEICTAPVHYWCKDRSICNTSLCIADEPYGCSYYKPKKDSK